MRSNTVNITTCIDGEEKEGFGRDGAQPRGRGSLTGCWSGTASCNAEPILRELACHANEKSLLGVRGGGKQW